MFRALARKVLARKERACSRLGNTLGIVSEPERAEIEFDG
jgi:hypothetical protein